MAERLCRHFPDPDARYFLLRARAAFDLGEIAWGRADLNSALDLDASDPVVAGLVLDMARPTDMATRRRAAQIIAASPRAGMATLAAALDVLLAPSLPVVARACLIEGRIEGWVAWLGPDRLDARLRRDAGPDFGFVVRAQDEHVLSSCARKGATISQDVPADALRHLTWSIEKGCAPVESLTTIVSVPPAPSGRRSTPARATPTGASVFPGCSVIVPIYDDPAATARCLDSLANQRLERSLEIVMVNDRPGDETMLHLCQRAVERYGFELVVNKANLGFGASARRGIAAADDTHDIMLLNADTVLPDEALRRLARAAYSHRDVGTVTPLSNNGELTSFPKPFVANHLGDPGNVRDVDDVARRVNAWRSVTLTNGVGFCLYIKRTCLDEVGGVPDLYGRGYFEDVELCLRAREAGYRNICAADVFVGHAGSRSFKGSKPELVARNTRVIQARFPDFASEELAFLKADPLGMARQRIEWALRKSLPRCRLVIAARSDCPVLHHRVQRLRRHGKAVLTLTRKDPLRLSHFALSSVGVDLHHESTVDLGAEDGRARLLARLRDVGVRSVEIVDDVELGPAFTQSLEETIPIRPVLDMAPDAAIGRAGSSRVSDRRPCPSARWLRPVAMHKMVSAVLSRRGIPHVTQKSPRARRSCAVVGRDALGILCPTANVEVDAILRHLANANADLPIVVVGRTFSDAALMAHPKLFVTGRVGYAQYGSVLDRCRVALLASLDRRTNHTLLFWLSRSTARSAAYFDWSDGAMEADEADLGLESGLSGSEAADRLLAWATARLRNDVVER